MIHSMQDSAEACRDEGGNTMPDSDTVNDNLLRRAVAEMRKRASSAEPSPWRLVVTDTESLDGIGGTCPKPNEEHIAELSEYGDSASVYDCCPWYSDTLGRNAEHIASWHPAVALAVADWLEGIDAFMVQNEVRGTGSTAPIRGAFAVARAYLGES